jgi:hypothetical protein
VYWVPESPETKIRGEKMKIITIAALFAAMALTGCVAYVKEFNASGHLIGECDAYQGFITGGPARCTMGTANPKDQQEPGR